MTDTVCSKCRGLQHNAPGLLRIHAHRHCWDAICAERAAARWFIIRVNPNGCVEGSTRVSSTTTIEDAHKKWTPRIADRRREHAAGWQHMMVNGTQWRQQAGPCLHGECTHT